MEDKELFELFESGAMLHRNHREHEQMLMNEGTFIAIVKKLLLDDASNQTKTTNMKSINIEEALTLAKAMPLDQAIQEIKAKLSGHPSTTVIKGDLVVILLNKDKD